MNCLNRYKYIIKQSEGIVRFISREQLLNCGQHYPVHTVQLFVFGSDYV